MPTLEGLIDPLIGQLESVGWIPRDPRQDRAHEGRMDAYANSGSALKLTLMESALKTRLTLIRVAL